MTFLKGDDVLKIKITYQDDKELEELLSHTLRQLIEQGAKLHKSDRHAPFKHAYITIKISAENGNIDTDT